MRARHLAFGAVASVLVVTGVQAGDLPVIVEPFDRSGMCDAMGAGYKLIPGTETCLKISAGVVTDYNVDFNFSGGGNNGAGTGTQRHGQRGSARASTVTQTEFGPLRTFVDMSVSRGSLAGR